jgi:non-specific serine/threonine protein kinase
LQVAEAAAPQLRGREQVAWLARLERDHDNLRAALAWSLEHPSGSEAALRLAGALYRFWWAHGHLAEGRTWLARALELDAQLGSKNATATEQARLCALEASGVLARQQADYHVAESLFMASLPLARELKDTVAIAGSLYWLGSTLFRLGDEQRARALSEESLALYRQLGRTGDTRRPLGTLAELALTSGNYEQAIALHEERMRCAREAADTLEVAGIQRYLGMLAGEQGQHDRATRLLDASYRTFEEFAHPEGMAMTLANLAWVSRAQGDASRAKQQFGQSLALFQTLGATWGIAECLVGLARLATDGAQFDVAARLFGSAAMLHETHSIRLANYQVAERAGGTRSVTVEQDLEAVRAALGTPRFEAAWQEGRELTVDDAVMVALAAPWPVPPEAVSDPEPRRTPTMIGPLTPRQQEVAVLVAQGLTNRQIAERLVVTERAAAAHVENILNRLGFNSRTQIAVWASEHGLLTGRADEPARN